MNDSDSKISITYNGEIYNYLEIRKELEEIGYFFKNKQFIIFYEYVRVVCSTV